VKSLARLRQSTPVTGVPQTSDKEKRMDSSEQVRSERADPLVELGRASEATQGCDTVGLYDSQCGDFPPHIWCFPAPC
jgi:hypothetical protein